MNKPHKHAEVIKAWADGAVVQFWHDYHGQWKDLKNGSAPGWLEDFKYRVKPEPEYPKTRLSEKEIMDFWNQVAATKAEKALRVLMNEAIKQAIIDGDVQRGQYDL